MNNLIYRRIAIPNTLSPSTDLPELLLDLEQLIPVLKELNDACDANSIPEHNTILAAFKEFDAGVTHALPQMENGPQKITWLQHAIWARKQIQTIEAAINTLKDQTSMITVVDGLLSQQHTSTGELNIEEATKTISALNAAFVAPLQNNPKRFSDCLAKVTLSLCTAWLKHPNQQPDILVLMQDVNIVQSVFVQQHPASPGLPTCYACEITINASLDDAIHYATTVSRYCGRNPLFEQWVEIIAPHTTIKNTKRYSELSDWLRSAKRIGQQRIKQETIRAFPPGLKVAYAKTTFGPAALSGHLKGAAYSATLLAEECVALEREVLAGWPETPNAETLVQPFAIDLLESMKLDHALPLATKLGNSLV
ncbi:MAG: hypothetical protein O3A01_07530 [bacterium]|nr:hypothetical protein [bacterium]